MLSTFLLAAVVLILLALQVILWAMFLRLGLRWARVADATMRRIAAATASVIALKFVLRLPLQLFTPTSEEQAVLREVLVIAVTVLVPCVVIMRVFRTRFFRSLQAWLPTLLPSAAMALAVTFVFRPFVCEAHVSPTNAMAPTLLGNHWRDRCPDCGQSNFCSPLDPRYATPEPRKMICENFHVREAPDVSQQAFGPDRFLVAKFLTPQRWDLVVFQYPEDPSQLYVMRLVGLPGESIRIENGAVWANGNKLEPPNALRGIEYASELPHLYRDVWGSKDRPAVLGADEYFVLGDFSVQSKDSRLWEQGAPGHPPFAVPKSHLRGVVTHIYWPPERCRILR